MYYRDFSKPSDGRGNMHKRGNIPDLPGLMLGTSPFIGAGSVRFKVSGVSQAIFRES